MVAAPASDPRALSPSVSRGTAPPQRHFSPASTPRAEAAASFLAFLSPFSPPRTFSGVQPPACRAGSCCCCYLGLPPAARHRSRLLGVFNFLGSTHSTPLGIICSLLRAWFCLLEGAESPAALEHLPAAPPHALRRGRAPLQASPPDFSAFSPKCTLRWAATGLGELREPSIPGLDAAAAPSSAPKLFSPQNSPPFAAGSAVTSRSAPRRARRLRELLASSGVLCNHCSDLCTFLWGSAEFQKGA